MSNFVVNFFVLIGGGFAPVPGELFSISISINTLPSGIIDGVTSSFSAALINCVVGVAPAWEAFWKGIWVPSSIDAVSLSIINNLGLEIIFTRASVCIASSSILRSVVFPANTPTIPPVAPAIELEAIVPPAAAVVISPFAVGAVPPEPEIVSLSNSLFLRKLERIPWLNRLTLEPRASWKLSPASTINTSTMTCLVGLSKLSIVDVIHSMSEGVAWTMRDFVRLSITKVARWSTEDVSPPASSVAITSLSCCATTSGSE